MMIQNLSELLRRLNGIADVQNIQDGVGNTIPDPKKEERKIIDWSLKWSIDRFGQHSNLVVEFRKCHPFVQYAENTLAHLLYDSLDVWNHFAEIQIYCLLNGTTTVYDLTNPDTMEIRLMDKKHICFATDILPVDKLTLISIANRFYDTNFSWQIIDSYTIKITTL